MGLGDWVMSSAAVKEINEKTGQKVFLGDGKNCFIDEQVFANNPRMATPKEKGIWVADYAENRPYISRVDHERKRVFYNDDFSPKTGEIWLTDKEKRNLPVGPYVVIEPNVKESMAHTVNKAWPYWEELKRLDLPFMQLGDSYKAPLFRHTRTKTFRHAMAVLSNAKLFVGTDGALHHAAAALGIPAVVIWTGYSSPRHLGYEGHVNIHDGSDPCGTFGKVCPHCLRKAAAISPEQVMQAIAGEYERIGKPRKRAYYDMSYHPATYDFVFYLANARSQGATEIVFNVSKGFSAKKFGSQEAERMYRGVIIPVCEAFEMPYSEGTTGDFQPPYLGEHVIKSDIKPMKLRKNCTGYSTITIRESIRNKHRDSNREAWDRIASEIGNCIVIEDAYKSNISIKDRIELYAHAKMNYGVSNGPMALCIMSDMPYTIFAQESTWNHFGKVKHGFQWPWAVEDQRLVWANDTYENIKAALHD